MTYYDIHLRDNIQHGPVDKSCNVQFEYRGGSHSQVFSGTIFAWHKPDYVKISSAYMNIADSYKDAIGGTLTITGGGTHDITAFVHVP